MASDREPSRERKISRPARATAASGEGPTERGFSMPPGYLQCYGLRPDEPLVEATPRERLPAGYLQYHGLSSPEHTLRSAHEAAAHGVSGTPVPLPHGPQIQASFGRHRVDGIQSHIGGPAAAAARALGARAFATGTNVAFAEAPDLHIAAHEAAHVVQQRAGLQLKDNLGQAGDVHEQHADAVADQVVQGKSAEALLDQYAGGPQCAVQRSVQLRGFGDYGQATQDTTRHLICDLTSPIVLGSEPRYELGQHGDELWASDTRNTYQWKVTERNSGRVRWQATTNQPQVRIPATSPGQLRVEVLVLANGNPSPIRLSLDQDIVAENSALTSSLAGKDADSARTLRELVNDFQTYITTAAQSTGPTGITPRVLASVLYIEVFNRPKQGREEEIDDVDGTLSALERGEWVLFANTKLDHSLGVGQIRQSTAAMVTGATPWVEQDRNNRGQARDQIKANYTNLTVGQKRMIFTQLQWPKSNIAMAARLLSTLKNRAHRYPTLTRAQFAANQTAVGVVATEYNSGGTNTPAAQAAASDYGTWAWNFLHDPVIVQFFSND